MRLRLLIFSLILLVIPTQVFAIEDPLSLPNNRLGIHILFTDEIDKASKLVNNEGKGAWGYVVIPIQASDRNRDKWQKFFDDCKSNQVIPIIRVATVPEGKNWQSPNNFDLIDFANFLDSLHWPVKNRYVIIFNEVNRSDEYGGYVSPEEYAEILNNSVDIFKEKSEDFFILPSALDNAAINTKFSLSHFTYLNRMNKAVPGLFAKIDGWNSHAYPNPEFSSRPDKSGTNKIDSFRYDLKIISKFTSKKLPVFITETGWSGKYLSEKQQEYYYQYAMEKVWRDNNIVVIAPFLLNAQDGPFKVFSFLKDDGTFKSFSDTFKQFASVGKPGDYVSRIQQSIPSPKESVTPASPSASAEQTSFSIIKKLYDNFISLLRLKS